MLLTAKIKSGLKLLPFVALILLSVALLRETDPWVAQFVVSPLLALCLLQTKIGDLRPSRTAIAVGLLISTAAFAFERHTPYSSSPLLVVGRLEGDLRGARSSLLREGIQRELRKVAPHSVRRSSDSSAIVESGLAVEGRERWLNVKVKNRHQYGPPSPWVPSRSSSLTVWSDIPTVGFSHGTDPGAGERYLAYLFGGLVGEAGLLRLAAAQAGGWTSTSHRALPLFIAGTLELQKLRQASRFEPKVLDCVISDLSRALPLLHSRDHWELFLAVHNNLAVARFMKAETRGSKRKERGIVRELREAVSQGHGKAGAVIKVAEENLEVMAKSSGNW